MPNSIDEIQDEIIQDFSKLRDWFEIYEYLIKIGKKLEVEDEKIQTDEYLVNACQSQVWLKMDIKKEKIHYTAFSDSLIVRGMIYFLLKILNDKNPKDIVNADLYFIEKIGLKSNLSPSRSNGLMAIIKHMKSYAEKAAKNL